MGHILIAHGSKVIRATLAKHLEGSLEAIELMEGDSAWQTLVLDHDIVAVITEPDLPRLTGFDLLERLRRSRLPRLREMPFYFVGSETKIEEIRTEALEQGATDFIVSGMGKAEVLDLLLRHGVLGGQENGPEQEESMPPLRATGLLSTGLFQAALAESFLAQGHPGSILLFGISQYTSLVDSLGKSLARRVVDQFASLLQEKIGPEDFIGYYGGGGFAIASKGTDLLQCAAFAQRVIKAVDSANVSVRGKRVTVAVNAAAASSPEDGVLNGEQLLQIGVRRLEHALDAGPGKIVVRG